MKATTPTQHEAPTSLDRILEPVREALLADAEDQAERIIAEAVRDARELTDTAKDETDAAVEQARRLAERSARALADQGLARLRTETHRRVLERQQQILQQLIDTVHESARELRTDPRYPALLDELESMARNQLGDTAALDRDASPDGGIVGEADVQRVDYRLTALADRALETLADDVVELWT